MTIARKLYNKQNKDKIAAYYKKYRQNFDNKIRINKRNRERYALGKNGQVHRCKRLSHFHRYEIRKEYAGGHTTMKALSIRYNVSWWTIMNIIHKKWKIDQPVALL